MRSDELNVVCEAETHLFLTLLLTVESEDHLPIEGAYLVRRTCTFCARRFSLTRSCGLRPRMEIQLEKLDI